MHYFVYPSKDTYITNETNFLNKNVGLDEILETNANTQLYRSVTLYQKASVSQSYSSLTSLSLFTGLVDGYLSGSGEDSLLVVVSDANFYNASLMFNGTITGSVNGIATTSSLVNQSGHLSGSLSGSLTGSWSGSICDASGYVTNFTGVLQGTVAGTSSVYNPIESFANVPNLSRALLQFDISSLSQSIATGDIKTGSLKITLKMEIDAAEAIPLSYSMYVYPVSQSWEMGDGYYETGGSDLGASWYYRNFNGASGSYWYPLTSSVVYQFVDYLNTASYASESFNKGGGTWYYNVPNSYTSASTGYCHTISASNSLIARQNFNYEKSNLSIDVSDIVKSWVCGCVPNEGFIVLSSLEISQAQTNTGTFKFFSKETNTIYTPYLDVQWDDSVYTTGSLVNVSESVPFTVIVRNLIKSYKFGAIPRIDVYSRPKNPLKNFVRGYQMNQYLTSSLLPTSSYYAIKDNESEKIIMDFDEATKLSCDGNMHYFVMDTTSLTQERYYRLLLKVVTDNETQIFDNGYIFKVTR